MQSIVMQMNTTVNRIYIFCAEDTNNSARRLEEDLSALSLSSQTPPVTTRFVIANLDNINSAFNRIKQDCLENDIKPLLHFDFHASAQHGLVIRNGFYLSWEWIGFRCREVNEICNCKLGVVMACCFGLYAIRAVHITERVPFQYLIGSQEIIYQGVDIDESFIPFYTALFETLSFEAALQNLPNKFKPFYAEKLLFVSLAKYIKNGTMGKGFHQRKEGLITNLVESGLYPTVENLKIWRSHIKDTLKLDADGVQELIDKYAAVFLGHKSDIKVDDLLGLIEE